MDQIADPFKIEIDEAIILGSKDGLFFAHYFLPETFSLDPPEWQKEFWQDINDPDKRYLSYEVYRDGGKTSTFRTVLLRGICYGLYRTGLVLSESRSHSRRTLSWIRNKVSNPNHLLPRVFGLQIGTVDNADELHIISTFTNTKIVLIAQGVEGQIRGINEDDNRPDFILCDDISSFESNQTPEAQQRIKEIFFGAVLNSLAAKAINPVAKLVNIGTISGADDVISNCKKDTQFFCKTHSVFLPNGESAWPSKWSTMELRRDKQSAEERGQLSTWFREKEGKFVVGNTTAFKIEKVHFHHNRPENCSFIMGLDPVPPPSDKALAKGLVGKDWEVFSVIAVQGKNYYVEEQVFNKGHEIEWSIDTFFSLQMKYRPLVCGVDSNGYQRTLANTIEREIAKRRAYHTHIYKIDDRQSKFHRITNTLLPIIGAGNFSVNYSLQMLIDQIIEYPGCVKDDHIESVALAIIAQLEYLPFLQAGADNILEQLALEEQSYQSQPGMPPCP